MGTDVRHSHFRFVERMAPVEGGGVERHWLNDDAIERGEQDG